MSVPCCVSIFNLNYVNLEDLASSFVSSEDPLFPVTNAYAGERRSKVWRSQGYFRVVDGDNTIVFTEGGGDLTATVVAGEYDSFTALAAAIKAAFEDVGAGTYTISQTALLKSQFVKSAGTFTIKWTHVNSAAMAALLGYSVLSDDTGSLTYVADVLRIHSEEFILWDLGTSANPQAFAMIGPRNKPVKLTPSAQVLLQGCEFNNFDSPSFSQVLPYDDEVIMAMASEGFHTEALRWWRVKFIDQNPLGYVEIGSFFLGEFTTFTEAKAQFPFEAGFIDPSDTFYSEGGQSFTDILQQTERFTVSWDFMSKADAEEFREFFREFGLGIPFFVAFDPSELYSTDLPRLTKFVKIEDQPRIVFTGPGRWALSVTFREEL